jgi:hypothetical protein
MVLYVPKKRLSWHARLYSVLLLGIRSDAASLCVIVKKRFRGGDDVSGKGVKAFCHVMNTLVGDPGSLVRTLPKVR